MILDSYSIGEFQSCRRRWVLNRAWRPIRWNPKRLADGILRDGILSLVGGKSLAEVTADARARYLQIAANPGLDVMADPYTLAKEWCGLMDTVLHGLVKDGLPKELTEFPRVTLNSFVEWDVSVPFDGKSLHRWITLDHWGAADLARELHSWRTIGDIALSQHSMILHVIEIGQIRSGRRSSAWTRGWKHPTMPSLRMRFKGKQAGAFQGWKPIYYSDGGHEAKEWVDQMWQEGVGTDLIHHIRLQSASEARAAAVTKDVLVESLEMRRLVDDAVTWDAVPMSRNACDTWSVCPFQKVCYAKEEVVDIKGIGAFQER